MLEPPASLAPGPSAPPAITSPPGATAPPRPSATQIAPTLSPTLPPTPNLQLSPTPDPARAHIPPGLTAITQVVQPGEDLSVIAQRWGVSLNDLLSANGFDDTNVVVYPGQVLLVPQEIAVLGPALKLIPDSELVYGPASVGFASAAFAAQQGGYLAEYVEEVEGIERSGGELVQLVAERHSVNPRLLLALLEHQSGWVTRPEPPPGTQTYAFGRTEGGTEGLYRQLQWAANALNTGYYQWREGSLTMVILGDGARAGLDPGLNAGTAALHYWFSLVAGREAWEAAVGPDGLVATYGTLFGNPFARAVEPLLPPDLAQPRWELPWAQGESWFYSAGPHGGWGSSSAWAALDFLPPGPETGCYVSPYWARAAAPGVVAHSDYGFAVLDFDGDGHAQTGWSLLYLHLANEGRVSDGDRLETGDPVGRPSCDGGTFTGTHLHVARRYNGMWLSPNVMPFALGGWEARLEAGAQVGAGRLWRAEAGIYKAPCDCRAGGNEIPNVP